MTNFSDIFKHSLFAFALLAAVGQLCGCGGVIIRPAPADLTLGERQVGGQSSFFVSDKILILDVDGTISNSRSDTGLFGGENPVSLFCEKLDRAESDPNIKAIVLRINSPGGSVTAVEIMYRRLMRFRDSRPEVGIIALIEDVGASGGYYLACACDKIMLLPSSVTGSIGVIMQTVSVADTIGLLGVKTRAIVSGPHKDMASPLKPLNESDTKILQLMVDEFYENFINVVATGRKDLSKDKIRILADGRVYTGTQAVDNGLADSLGDMHDAIEYLKKSCHIRSAGIIMYHRPTGWRGSVESSSAVSMPKASLANITPEMLADMARPHFMYIWR